MVARFLPIFEAPEFVAGHMVAQPGCMPWFSLDEKARCDAMKGQVPNGLAELQHADLVAIQRWLFRLWRGERVVEGLWNAAFTSGEMITALRRVRDLHRNA